MGIEECAFLKRWARSIECCASATADDRGNTVDTAPKRLYETLPFIVHMFYYRCMEKDRCTEAATLLLAAVKQEKQARADQHRAILTLAQT